MDRFSLLLLEPSEIYFCDVAVTYLDDSSDENHQRGRLKICSKSVVFVPQSYADDQKVPPLLKFPLSDCTEIKGQAHNQNTSSHFCNCYIFFDIPF